MRLVRLIAAALGLSSCAASAADAPFDRIENAVYEICPKIFDGSLSLNDASALKSLGYKLSAPDEEGQWAEFGNSSYVIRLGVGPNSPGCRIRYSGSDSVALYDSVLNSALQRGFVFVDGKRKAPEPQFVMDTLAVESGPVGIVSMFRVMVGNPTAFAMTVFPATQTN